MSVKIEGKDNTGDDILRNYILWLPTILDAFNIFVLYCNNRKINILSEILWEIKALIILVVRLSFYKLVTRFRVYWFII